MLANYYHLPFFRKLRTLARKMGLLKIVKNILSKRQATYEEAFHEALKKSIRPGDTVWDVGANVGVYTKYFLDWVGGQGCVIAFEPLPSAQAALKANIEKHSNGKRAVIVPLALADRSGSAVFAVTDGGNEVTTTARLANPAETDMAHQSISVEVSTADTIVHAQQMNIPTVVKIDVEGFEEDVLRGGVVTFSNSNCKNILVEMHFERMDDRKIGDSATRIVSMLRDWGYYVNWVDASHLHAARSRFQ